MTYDANGATSDISTREKLMQPTAKDNADAESPAGTTPSKTRSQYLYKSIGCAFPPCRLVFALLGFYCFFNLYSLRVNLSVALVSMVNTTYLNQMDNSPNQSMIAANTESVCEDPDHGNQSTPHVDGPFNWDQKQQGMLLGAFFYGYIVTQLPGGLLAEKLGGKIVLLVGIAWTTLWTLLTPVICEAGDFVGLMIIRILEGIGEGVAYPGMHVMLSKWAPPLERGRIATFVYSGSLIGTVITMPVSGVLCQNVSWQSVFYVFGVISAVWCVMWIFLVYDKPCMHPRISESERHYIESSLQQQKAKPVTMKTPWLAMAKSPAVYALMLGNFSHNWGNFFLLTVTPQFLSYILKFKVQSSGIVAGAPYLSMWMGMLAAGFLSDFLLSRKLFSVTAVRKLFVFLGFMIPAASLVGIGYIQCDRTLAVILLVINGLFIGLSWGGWGVNHLDIAPPFAGTLFGITNCISTVPGFLAPAIVGALTYRNQTFQAWRSAFYITAAVLVFGTLAFLILGTGQRQKWSYPEEEKIEMEDPKLAKKKEEEEDKTNSV